MEGRMKLKITFIFSEAELTGSASSVSTRRYGSWRARIPAEALVPLGGFAPGTLLGAQESECRLVWHSAQWP